ncbi:MAG: hypothetical protein AMXMBFR84_04170 [Candidatus Hydrogenedentota bacterium]
MADAPYLVLARKWRPGTFETVVGQEHVTRTLQNAITSGRIGHAFLFIGSRGVGKTTTARILAKALNCEVSDKPTPNPCGECDNCRTIAAGTNIDVMEIDGASNNTVDDVRQIRENVRLVPSRSRYKIYVIDEVHQLSGSAFNALLKTLEEPPEHAVFILATTEAHKVPATIISRCQRYDFRRVGMERLQDLLRRIIDSEGVTCSEEALYAIARSAEGGIRDAESILEQLISYCGKTITYRDVFDVLGLVDWQVLHRLCRAMLDKDIAAQLRVVEDIVIAGKDLSQFLQDILNYFRNLLVCKTADAKALVALPDAELAEMQELSGRFSITQLIKLVEQFAELSRDFDTHMAQRIALETQLIRLSKVSVDVSLDSVLEKLAQLSEGGPPPAPRTGDRTEDPPGPFAGDATESPAPAGRIAVTPKNLARFWEIWAEAVSAESMQLGGALAQARPVQVEGDTLTLRLGAGNAHARQVLSKPEHVATLNEVLRARSANLRHTVLEDGPASDPEPEPNGNGRRTRPATQPEMDHPLANDPHVARVLRIFRGRIVDVKHGAKPADPDAG